MAIGSLARMLVASTALGLAVALVLLAIRGTAWRPVDTRLVIVAAAAPLAWLALVQSVSTTGLLMRSMPPGTPRLRGSAEPEPMGDAGPTQVWITNELPGGGQTLQLLTVDGVSLAQMTAFAQAVTNGATLAVAHWTGAGCIFTRQQYTALTAELARVDWVTPAAGNQPRRLTAAGRAMLRKIAQGGYDGG